MADVRDTRIDEEFNFEDFSDDDLTGLQFTRCKFIQCRFFGANVDALFEHCKFDACEFQGVSIDGSQFFACSFDGAEFDNSTFDDSNFLVCNLSNTRFVECSIYGTTISRCDMSGMHMVSCDARFITIEDAEVDGVNFEDTDLSDGDLQRIQHTSMVADRVVELAELEAATGNARTKLPPNVWRPSHWLETDSPSTNPADSDAIPTQLPAPLRVIWREQKLVPDPRGGAQERFRDPSLMAIYRALSADVSAFVESPPTNHPIVERVILLNKCLNRGISAINPAEVGYHVEVLKAQLPRSRGEISSNTDSSLGGIIAGASVLISQFEEWRTISANNDEFSSGSQGNLEIADSLRSVAAAIRSNGTMFDRRVSDSLALQADDIVDASGEPRIQRGAANSTNNIFSALSVKFWRAAKGVPGKAGDELLKAGIREFISSNKEHLAKLMEWAPKTLAWIRDVWIGIF